MCNDYIVIYTLRLRLFTPTLLLIYRTHHHPPTHTHSFLFFIYPLGVLSIYFTGRELVIPHNITDLGARHGFKHSRTRRRIMR